MGRLGRLILVLLSLLAGATAAAAEGSWLEVTGRAPIDGDLDRARRVATADAMRQALLSRGARVSSRSSVDQHMQVSDSVAVQTQGYISHVDQIAESQQQDQLNITLRVRVESRNQACSAGDVRPVKSLVFSSFTRESPIHSAIGRLDDVDTHLPQELARRGYLQSRFIAQVDSAPLVRSTTTWGQAGGQAQQARQLAQKHGAQYVVTGKVTSLAMTHRDAYLRASKFARVKWWRKRDLNQREFSFHVQVLDGMTGNVVFDQVYEDHGQWQYPPSATIGFSSAEFWESDYGSKVDRVLTRAVSDIGKKVHCQPMMIPVHHVVSDDHVYIDLGANQGLKVGDVMSVFRHEYITVNSANYDQTQAIDRIAMEPSPTTLTVVQVHPQFSRAKVSAQLNSARRYLGVIW